MQIQQLNQRECVGVMLRIFPDIRKFDGTPAQGGGRGGSDKIVGTWGKGEERHRFDKVTRR
jgi:hypothetical protein